MTSSYREQNKKVINKYFSKNIETSDNNKKSKNIKEWYLSYGSDDRLKIYKGLNDKVGSYVLRKDGYQTEAYKKAQKMGFREIDFNFYNNIKDKSHYVFRGIITINFINKDGKQFEAQREVNDDVKGKHLIQSKFNTLLKEIIGKTFDDYAFQHIISIDVKNVFYSKFNSKQADNIIEEIKAYEDYTFKYFSDLKVEQNMNTEKLCFFNWFSNKYGYLKKCNEKNILKISGNSSIYDGFNCKQIVDICNFLNIKCYVISATHKMIYTNYKGLKHNKAIKYINPEDKDIDKGRNNDSFMFMINNNHCYPVIDSVQLQSIIQKNLNRNEYMTLEEQLKPKKDEIELNEDDYIIIDDPNENLETFITELENIKQTTIFFNTSSNYVHTLFHFLVKQKREIHNMDINYDKKEAKITQFKYKGYTLIHNENIQSVKIAVDRLNAKKKKYNFNNKSLQKLTNEIYARKVNKNTTSVMKKDIMNILYKSRNNAYKYCIEENYNNSENVAIDVNKAHTYHLQTCGNDNNKYGWAKYSITDDIYPYDGSDIKTGIYYIITDDTKLFKNAGWYYDILVQQGLDDNIIEKNDIVYQYVSSDKLPSNHYDKFIDYIYTTINDNKIAKNMINFFIGSLAKIANPSMEHYYTTNFENVIYEQMNNENIEIKMIYEDTTPENDNSKHICHFDNELYNFLHTTQYEVVEKEPILYHIILHKQHISKLSTNLPIHSKVLDLQHLHNYKKICELEKQGGQFIAINSDTLVFKNIQSDRIITGDNRGQWKICDIPKNLPLLSDYVIFPKLFDYTFPYDTWITPNKYTTSYDDLLEYGIQLFKNNQSFLVNGRAGTGKTYYINKMLNDKLNLNKNEFIILTPTHKAKNNFKQYKLKANTIHKALGIYRDDFGYSISSILKLVKAGLKCIFIDEISMISKSMLAFFIHIKSNFNIKFFGFGDFFQFRSIGHPELDFSETVAVKHLFDNNKIILSETKRSDNQTLYDNAFKFRCGGDIDFSVFGNKKTRFSICRSNYKVIELNNFWNEIDAKKAKQTKKVKGHKKQDIILFEGLELLAYKNNFKNNYLNSETFTVKSFTNDKLFLLNEDKEIINIPMGKSIDFRPFYAITSYKAQGISIEKEYTIYDICQRDKDLDNLIHGYVCLTRATDIKNINIIFNKPKKQKIFIYKYINKINNKIYIGQTSNIEKRSNQHKEHQDNTDFHKDVEKWGHQYFDYVILETNCDIVDDFEIQKLEQKYIELEREKGSKLYNMCEAIDYEEF